MSCLATYKHCGFSWEKGTDSGHSKDECIERLKAENEELKIEISAKNRVINILKN